MMHWYVIHTKPREERRALFNLEQQQFDCYLPLLKVEKIRQRRLQCVEEPLFPRYLFIRLDMSDQGQNWATLRSTKGVSRLVMFGDRPARLEDDWVDGMRAMERQRQESPEVLFSPGDKVRITEGPFVGLEGVFHLKDAEQRVLILVEWLHKSVKVPLHPAQLVRL